VWLTHLSTSWQELNSNSL